ncbi:uncharacterized protein LOC103387629 isoform X3 [Cynoglossus semilaevis]|uniref:uncharacterized protein LOC103387629 isoform X3 n=1 Tax=Cynoglossus semilaevis TaxID=244447 RepID=UPI000496C6E0|nr:uncharacterized protein LOC103387629 isoform X3 [Cynoglossus semilaevis]
MLKTLTKKLRRHSLNEIHPFQLKISYHGSKEGLESDDSEGENQELVQIDKERRRNGALTPLATSHQHNQGPLSPTRLRRLRLLLGGNLDCHSSEEELERITYGDNRKWMSTRSQHTGDHLSSASSDEELQVVQPVAQPIILTHFDQTAPYRRYRHNQGGDPGRPSLDLEKMQQKMLLKKNCGGKTRSIKIRNLTGSRPPPRYSYDPSFYAFRSLSTAAPCSSLIPCEDPPHSS